MVPVQNVVPDVVYTSTTNTAASEGAGSHDEPESSDPKISELVAQIKLLQEQLAAANKSTQMSGKDMGKPHAQVCTLVTFSIRYS